MPAILRKSLPKLLASLVIIGSYASSGIIVVMVTTFAEHVDLQHYEVSTMWISLGCHCSIGAGCSSTGWAVSPIHTMNRATTSRWYLT